LAPRVEEVAKKKGRSVPRREKEKKGYKMKKKKNQNSVWGHDGGKVVFLAVPEWGEGKGNADSDTKEKGGGKLEGTRANCCCWEKKKLEARQEKNPRRKKGRQDNGKARKVQLKKKSPPERTGEPGTK